MQSNPTKRSKLMFVNIVVAVPSSMKRKFETILVFLNTQRSTIFLAAVAEVMSKYAEFLDSEADFYVVRGGLVLPVVAEADPASWLSEEESVITFKEVPKELADQLAEFATLMAANDIATLVRAGIIVLYNMVSLIESPDCGHTIYCGKLVDDEAQLDEFESAFIKHTPASQRLN